MAEKRGRDGEKKAAVPKVSARSKTSAAKKPAAKKAAAKKPSAKKSAPRKDPKPPARRKAPAKPAPRADDPPPRRRAAAKPDRAKRSLGRRVFRAAVLAGIWGFVAVGCLVGYLYLTLPSLDEATRLKRGPTAALLAKNGAFLASYGELHGVMVTVAELPAHLPRAVIAIEDRRFYEHGGIDPWGVARALFVNITSGEIRQGASTITQQLAKNLLLTHKRSYWRKAREALLALEIERKFGKDQILTVYLNRVYFGGGAYGVDAAARRFFGKPATEVTLWEAALLAAVLKAPARLAPDRNPEAAAARAKLVLNAMAEAKFISRDAAAQPMGVASAAATALTAPGGGGARYFADWALDQAEGFMAGLDSDVLVETTLDLDLQRAAEAAVARILNNRPKNVSAANWPSQAALVAMTPDGAVRAMVGGINYRASQFNRVTQAERQMGSTFKPFVYLAALEAGWEPDDRINDGPIRIGKWQPRNYKDRYYGDVTLRAGLARSLNAAAVRLAESIGRQNAVKAARRLGLNRSLPNGPSVTLGAGSASLLELTGAYAAFANHGRFATPHGIREIRARDGAVLYEPVSEPSQAVDPAVALRMTDMLGAVVKWGSGVRAKIDRDAAGKTGTSQSGRDAWFIGYTADLVAGVWVGHDDNRPIKSLFGSGPPTQIWQAFMAEAGAKYAPKPLPGLHGYADRPRTRVAAPALPTKKEEPAGSPQFAPKKRPFVEYKYPDGDEGGN